MRARYMDRLGQLQLRYQGTLPTPTPSPLTPILAPSQARLPLLFQQARGNTGSQYELELAQQKRILCHLDSLLWCQGMFTAETCLHFIAAEILVLVSGVIPSRRRYQPVLASLLD